MPSLPRGLLAVILPPSLLAGRAGVGSHAQADIVAARPQAQIFRQPHRRAPRKYQATVACIGRLCYNGVTSDSGIWRAIGLGRRGTAHGLRESARPSHSPLSASVGDEPAVSRGDEWRSWPQLDYFPVCRRCGCKRRRYQGARRRGLRLGGWQSGQPRSRWADRQRQLDFLHPDRSRLEGWGDSGQQPYRQFADATAVAHADRDATRRANQDTMCRELRWWWRWQGNTLCKLFASYMEKWRYDQDNHICSELPQRRVECHY
jgi:hypothetical protein